MLKAVRHSPAPKDDERSLRIIPGGRLGDESQAEPPPLDIGKALKDARTHRRISVERAASDTRISTKALRALEASGPAEDLPDPPYDRYFLKEYARYLGADPEPLVLALDTQQGREPQPPLGQLFVEPAPRRWSAITMGVACVAILAALAYLGLTSEQPAPLAGSKVVAPPAPPAAQPPASPPQGSGGAAAAPTGIRAALQLSGPCWIQATVDGNVVMAETVPEGETFRLRAKRRLDLVLGNSGGVRLTVNGRVVATGNPGEVVRLSFVWKNGHLQAV